jgi:hypothetical protein
MDPQMSRQMGATKSRRRSASMSIDASSESQVDAGAAGWATNQSTQVAGGNGSNTPAIVGDEVSMDEAEARHYQEWVLMKVTARDEYHAPARGVVLFTSEDRDVLSQEVIGFLKRNTEPLAPGSLYIFKALPRILPGETIEQAEKRFEKERAAILDRDRDRGKA